MRGRTLETDDRTVHEGDLMIDWDSDNWGGGVTYAADGSWLGDKQPRPVQEPSSSED